MKWNENATLHESNTSGKKICVMNLTKNKTKQKFQSMQTTLWRKWSFVIWHRNLLTCQKGDMVLWKVFALSAFQIFQIIKKHWTKTNTVNTNGNYEKRTPNQPDPMWKKYLPPKPYDWLCHQQELQSSTGSLYKPEAQCSHTDTWMLLLDFIHNVQSN